MPGVVRTLEVIKALYVSDDLFEIWIILPPRLWCNVLLKLNIGKTSENIRYCILGKTLKCITQKYLMATKMIKIVYDRQRYILREYIVRQIYRKS